MIARLSLPVVLVLAAVLAGVVTRGVWLHGEVFSPADLALMHAPWDSVAPEDFVPSNPVLSDQVTQFQPWFKLTAERAAAGELPLWNPRAAAGQPLIANLQSAVFSPFALWRRVLSFDHALLAAALSKMLLAASGMALLLRLWKRSTAATALASLAFAFGGFQCVWLGWPQASTSAFLPWLLYVVERRVRRGDEQPSRFGGVGFAVLVGAMLLCGHIETALHVSMAVAGYVVLRLPWRRELRRSLGELVTIAGWSLVGLALASVQIAPFVDYLMQSHAYADRVSFGALWRAAPWDAWPFWLVLFAAVGAWCGLAAWTARCSRSTPMWVATLLLALGGAVLLAFAEELGLSNWYRLLVHPDAYGHPASAMAQPFTGERSYVELNGAFVGVLTLPLALLGLLAAPRAAVRTFAVLGSVAAIAAYRVPGLAALVDRIPLFDVSHNHRLMFVFGFCTCALAAFGVDALRGEQRDVEAPRRSLRAGMWGVVIAAALAFVMAPWTPRFTDDVPVESASRVAVTPSEADSDVVPGAEGIFGAVVPVTQTLEEGDALVVRGWAIAGDRVPGVRVTLEQGARRHDTVLDIEDFGAETDVELPFEWRDHPLARLATYEREFALAEFSNGPIWLTVTLVDGERDVVVEHRAVRFRASRDVAPRWWVTAAVALVLLVLATRITSSKAGTAWAWCAVLVVVADVGLFADVYHVTAPSELLYPETPLTTRLNELDGARVWGVGSTLLPANTAGVYGLSDVRSYDALEVERFEQFLALLEPAPGRARHPDEMLDVTHPLFALLDVEHVLAHEDWMAPIGAPLERLDEIAGVVVYRYTGGNTNAFVARRAENIDAALDATPAADAERGATPRERRQHARNVGAAIGSAYRGARDWRDVIVVEGAGEPITPPGEALPEGDPVEAEIEVLDIAPERRSWRVTSSAPAWFVVTDAFHTGWRAMLDDASTPIVPAFFGLRAVRIPAGTSTIVMTYEPFGFRFGAALTITALLALVIVFARSAWLAVRSR